ncbi:zinc transporter ZIP1-like [Tigriopus californicus]|uniref:zinc transporter ZIP1-like n=1 Tax=Tigriopus californicus TaxID=6832 RepID=UPI0027DA6983|nr:zinc transporter ZIP1-like [Tigriopus californicus]
MDSLLTAKIISMALLGVVSFLLSVLAIGLFRYLSQESKIQRSIISNLLCFGGGVLIAISVIHMLPEVRETFTGSGVDLDEKPVAEILTCVGFFLVYLIEELAFACSGTHHHTPELPTTRSHGDQENHGTHSITCQSNHNDLVEISPGNEEDSLKRKHGSISSAKSYDTFPQEHPQKESIFTGAKFRALRDFMTMLALTLHAVFEGLAIGIEEETTDVWKLFAGVALHKFVIAFCFGLELMANRTNMKLMLLYLITFAIFSPLGVGIGIGINEAQSETASYAFTVGTLQALSAGTILYVVVFEILQRERQKDVNGFLQLTALVIGFLAMMLVELFVGHHHHHDDERLRLLSV